MNVLESILKICAWTVLAYALLAYDSKLKDERRLAQRERDGKMPRGFTGNPRHWTETYADKLKEK